MTHRIVGTAPSSTVPVTLPPVERIVHATGAFAAPARKRFVAPPATAVAPPTPESCASAKRICGGLLRPASSRLQQCADEAYVCTLFKKHTQALEAAQEGQLIYVTIASGKPLSDEIEDCRALFNTIAVNHGGVAINMFGRPETKVEFGLTADDLLCKEDTSWLQKLEQD